MVVMDLKLNNFLALKNFHMNMSYPKKIVNSYIKDEFLKDRPNFRYKKVNIIMGGNATGKTSIGKMMMSIFNFIDKKLFAAIQSEINNKSEEASFSIDFIIDNSFKLYRVEAVFTPIAFEKYKDFDIKIITKVVDINKNDSYESSAKRLKIIDTEVAEDYVKELEKVEDLSWLFSYTSDAGELQKGGTENFREILEYTLRALDPAIQSVEKISEVENSYVIKTKTHDVIIQEGKVVKANLLSSGTLSGIDIAFVVSSIKEGGYGFYYCDEKVSYIHSEVEKAFLSLMISCLQDDNQLFFTTHNTDILELALPKHSYTFLRKNVENSKQPISCVYASDFLKRNTDSLRNAVENDLFSVSPNIDLIYQIGEI